MNYSKIFMVSMLSSLLILPVQADTELNNIISSKQQTQLQAQKTQQQIVALDEETNEVVNEYRSLLRENAILDTYNQQLDKQQLQQQVQTNVQNPRSPNRAQRTRSPHRRKAQEVPTDAKPKRSW